MTAFLLVFLTLVGVVGFIVGSRRQLTRGASVLGGLIGAFLFIVLSVLLAVCWYASLSLY